MASLTQNQTGQSNTQQTTRMSPEAQALFASRFGLGNDFLGAFPGGVQHFADTGAYSMTPETQGVRNGYMNWLGNYGPSIQKNPFDYTSGSGFNNSPLLNDLFKEYGNVIDQTQNQSTGLPREAVAGVSSPGVASAMAPDAAVAAAKGILSQIAGPGITSSLSSMGMGRSGAEAEAISKRGLEMSLPIAQQAEQEALQASISNANNATNSSVANAGLATNASSTNAGLAAQQANLRAQIIAALQGKKLDAGLQIGMAKPAYDLSLGSLIPGLAKSGVEMGQLPNTLLQGKQSQDSQMLLALLGLPQASGGTTTSSTATSQNTSQDSSMGFGGILSQAAILTALLGPQVVQQALKGGVDGFKKLWAQTFGSDGNSIPGGGAFGDNVNPGFSPDDTAGIGPDPFVDPFGGADPGIDPGIDFNPATDFTGWDFL